MSGTRCFADLLSNKENKTAEALDVLVESLNHDKERTIFDFLGDSGSEDFLWALVHMLSSKNIRIASNSAYVIGSLAETELGSHRVLSLTQRKKAVTILQDLTHMLTVEDAETVMNAAGTLGTLAETEEGRQWMLGQPCIEEMMTNITFLLGSDNHWTASNSALVLARITISESGSHSIMEHPRSKYILTRLIQSLGNDTAGRGMNAAFAIGRLLDTKIGKERLLNCSDSEKMITSLCRMLSKGDMGGAKNACFAVSCLATDVDGNQRVLINNLFQDVTNRLILLLSNSEDPEAAWFAAMTLRTISTHKQGVLRLRQNNDVESSLLKNQNKPRNSKELNEEINKTLLHLKKLDQPDPPDVKVTGSTSVQVEWKPVNTQSGLQITYKLYCDNKVICKGPDLKYTAYDLRPFTSYTFKVRASTLGDDSPFSGSISVTTDEDVPSPPTFLRIVGSTPTQLRLAWNQPENHNGILRGYSVFLGEKILDTVPDMSYIITRLTSATRYNVKVCAATVKGMGETANIEAVTGELGAHAPEKPTATVLGRNEIHVTWMPPAVPLGRFFRYELCMNDRVIYQGTDKVFKATGLTPDTDYVFVAVAITSEGRCVSDPTKKRTLKDKSQNEPGHHKLKTHSFMAKEFQVMQEKSKSHSNIMISQKQKSKLKKKVFIRPSSSVSTSNASETSAITEGTWAHSSTEQDDIPRSNGHDENKKSRRKFQNSAVLGGGTIKKEKNYKKLTENRMKTQVSSDSSSAENTENRVKSSPGPKTTINDQRSVLISAINSNNTGKPQPVTKEFTFNKENSAKQPKTLTSHGRARLHRGQAIMKGKKVLKSDKELLATMTTTQNDTSATSYNQYKPVEAGFKPAPYYPDIVSSLRKQHAIGVDEVGDLKRYSPDSPDSLNAEPGTAREGDIDFNAPKTEVPPIKPPLPHHITRERHINEYQMHEYSKRKSLLFRLQQHNYSASKLSTKSTNLYSDHVILKSTPTSKYGIKYSHGHVGDSSESTIDNDSAFHSLSHIQDGQHKPLQLKPIKSDNFSQLSKASSERHLNQQDLYHDSRTIPSRLKTPPKGYWSDHDISPPKGRKKAPTLTPINYRTFQGAHRPTKSIRLESPLVTASDTWFVGDSLPHDNNRYKFIPTQLRTQPANLPTQGRQSGKVGSRLESLNEMNWRSEAKNTRGGTAPTLSPSPPVRKRHSKKGTVTPNETRDHLYRQYLSRKNFDPNSRPEDEKRSNVNARSILAAISHHHGYQVANNLRQSVPASTLPSNNNVPHTVLSPLTPSDLSTTESPSTNSSKSPRLRMTSSTSSFYHSMVPSASGYAISPSNSLSPLLSGDKNNMAHIAMQRQMALVPGGGDAV